MAWDGYFLYAGPEFINAPRTEAYAVGADWFLGCVGGGDLAPILGDLYQTPALDSAPWTDPDRPESYGFWGVYPLGVTGLEDSTRVGIVQESTMDGGTIGRIRNGTRTVVFNVALVGDSDCAVEYGARWLRRLLMGAACGISSSEACSGDDLCYLACEPMLDWDSGGHPSEALGCLDPFERNLRRVVFNTGPTFTAKHAMTDGGAMWTATFTAVAGNPWEFSTETPIVEGFGIVPDPYVSEPPGLVNMNGLIVEDQCLPVAFQPVVDPGCPAFIVPPDPPKVPIGCYVPPVNWLRRQFTIPEEFIPLWGEVVPKIEIKAPVDSVVRNVRLRFYADVDGDNDISDDTCAYCGDIVVSYVPMGETIVLDGSDQLVYVDSPVGQRRRADALVFNTDGEPMEWPVLSCGFGYIVTVDMEQTAIMPSVSLSLFSRAA